MELRHLRYFRAVAEELHFGRAAQRLHIAQPPLSAQIRQLEAELGVELLTRSTRRVELTPAGTAYLTQVVAILDAVESAGAQARRIAEGQEGHLTIGCVGSATYSLLPQLVRTLRDELPGWRSRSAARCWRPNSSPRWKSDGSTSRCYDRRSPGPTR